MKTLYERIGRCVRSATPGALKTIRWIVTLTLGISLAMFVLQYVGLLDWISACVSPLFHIFGLRGEAAMAFVSGYFINIYSSIAVISTLDLTAREITILATMSTAAHAILVEGAVLHRTGTPTLYSITLRTLAAIGLGVGLNLILPGRPEAVIGASFGEVEMFCIDEPFWPLFCEWAIGAVRLAVVMCTLIYLLNIFQRILYEFGVMAWLSKLLRPLLTLFGLPEKTSFLWIVANVIGLSYGSAAMMDEVARGNISRREINLVNTHIGISHSNLEDLLLYASIGGVWYIILLARWVLVAVLVWLLRGYYALGGKL